MSASVLTANRLDDGVVVFWSGEGWVEQFPDAERFSDPPAAAAALEAARLEVTRLLEPYLVEVAVGPAGPAPASLRERIRALGPSVRPDLGKQAEAPDKLKAVQAAEAAARSSGRLNLIRRK